MKNAPKMKKQRFHLFIIFSIHAPAWGNNRDHQPHFCQPTNDFSFTLITNLILQRQHDYFGTPSEIVMTFSECLLKYPP